MPHPGARQQAFIPINQSLTESCRTAGNGVWCILPGIPQRDGFLLLLLDLLAMSDSLWPHGLQHAWLHWPLLSLSLLIFMSVVSVMPSTISFSVAPFSLCLQSFPASGSSPMSRLFTSGGQSIGISFNFSISLSNEYSRLISFGINWFDLLAVQGTLKSLQHHNSKASVL